MVFLRDLTDKGLVYQEQNDPFPTTGSSQTHRVLAMAILVDSTPRPLP